ncbi:uncharacterized protein LOC127755771 [Oryza glaberrima]|uniref:uncharacterized protein LOC127755771 n=1 Tax=Oryza glaberrima TaxID=4538 RepID=UPI00224BEC43|nr:uncharacterized protein LOC127755771 [Oryza glaberrima]
MEEELAKKSTMGIDLNVVPTDGDDGSRDTPKKAATAKNFDLTVMRSDRDDGSRQTRKKVARNFDLNVKLEEPDEEEMKTDSATHDEAAPEKDIYQTKPCDLYDFPPTEEEENDPSLTKKSTSEACQENEDITVALNESRIDDDIVMVLDRNGVESETIEADPITHSEEQNNEEEEEDSDKDEEDSESGGAEYMDTDDDNNTESDEDTDDS